MAKKATRSNKKKAGKKRSTAAPRSTKKKTTAKSNKPGRPAGSKTQKVIGKASPSRCPKCKSTRREPYQATKSIPSRGIDPSDGPYTHVVFRVTRCRKCGQARTDRSLENRAA